MAVVKVIEILAESENGWEDAAKNGIMEASKTVECINQINIENLKAVVKDNKIIKYRINAKVSFVVND